jgi:hypothetical protein
MFVTYQNYTKMHVQKSIKNKRFVKFHTVQDATVCGGYDFLPACVCLSQYVCVCVCVCVCLSVCLSLTQKVFLLF